MMVMVVVVTAMVKEVKGSYTTYLQQRPACTHGWVKECGQMQVARPKAVEPHAQQALLLGVHHLVRMCATQQVCVGGGRWGGLRVLRECQHVLVCVVHVYVWRSMTHA